MNSVTMPYLWHQVNNLSGSENNMITSDLMTSGYGFIQQYEGMSSPIKEIIRLTKSVLYPPNPNAPRPTTREKPLGCKTVFVGGLPEKVTEEIIKEIFDTCGEVETIRMSTKNFCHIRFTDELCIEYAICLSGYMLKIENKDETSYCSRLHVDYAQARDDQHDYECKQRAHQRLVRHQQQENCRPVSPPIVHFNECEAKLIGEKLKSEETFREAATILIAWLKRGECTKKNASTFYSLIQAINSHTSSLREDKIKFEERVNDAKKELKEHNEKVINQYCKIGKIFEAASLQKCWDHFTKAQRRRIEMWKSQIEELKVALTDEIIHEREEEEMELSDNENDDITGDTDIEQVTVQLKENISKLQEENKSLQCQLEVSENEKKTMESKHEEEIKHKDVELAAIKQALHNSQRELLNLSQISVENEAGSKTLYASKPRKRSYDNLLQNDDLDLASSTCSTNIMANEARLIGVISAFLHVHPFGANIDYICSYLHQIDSTIKTRDVETLMKRYPTVFRENSSGIGASLEKKWVFMGYKI